jgi:LexA-binding, inner membrane-associated putative hydrolase
MTSFGHLGSGMLIASLSERTLLKGQFSPATLGILIFLSILPDLDSVPALLLKKWRPGGEKLDHHNYVTHTPIFYLLLALVVWIAFGKVYAILFLLLTLTHLLLDSWGTDDGIMWLWPLKKDKYSFFRSELHAGGLYGIQYYLHYVRHLQVVIPEVLLFTGGLVAVILGWR